MVGTSLYKCTAHIHEIFIRNHLVSQLMWGWTCNVGALPCHIVMQMFRIINSPSSCSMYINLNEVVQQTFATVKKVSSSRVEALRRLPNMADRWWYVGLLVWMTKVRKEWWTSFGTSDMLGPYKWHNWVGGEVAEHQMVTGLGMVSYRWSSIICIMW